MARPPSKTRTPDRGAPSGPPSGPKGKPRGKDRPAGPGLATGPQGPKDRSRAKGRTPAGGTPAAVGAGGKPAAAAAKPRAKVRTPAGGTPAAASPRGYPAAPALPGNVRIIGGTLRGRRLPVIADAGLRPTPDRVRETLFNWLAPHIEGSRCLDLFAGCGALGVEALSRGAAHCTFVETGHAAARSLATTLDTLGLAARARLVMGNARRFLGTTPAGPFDIIFLDPPFDSGLLAPCLADLPAILAPRAWIYVEQPRGAPLPPLPAGLHVHRCGQTRQISYLILAGPASHGHEAGAGGAEDAGGAASGEALPEPAP